MEDAINLINDNRKLSHNFEENKINKKFNFEYFFESTLKILFGIVLYIALGYIGYFFNFLISNYIIKNQLNYKCYDIISICFFIEVVIVFFIILLWTFIYYMCKKY